jgi:hypothetical protein
MPHKQVRFDLLQGVKGHTNHDKQPGTTEEEIHFEL